MRVSKERSRGEISQEVSQSLVEKKKTVTVVCVQVHSTRFILRVALPFSTIGLITVTVVASLLVEMWGVGNWLEGMVFFGPRWVVDRRRSVGSNATLMANQLNMKLFLVIASWPDQIIGIL